MPDPDYRALCLELIETALTLKDAWRTESGLDVDDDPSIERVMGHVYQAAEILGVTIHA